MTRPKRTGAAGGRPAAKKGATSRAGGGPKGAAGARRGPKRNVAQGRDGTTRDSVKPVRERSAPHPEARSAEGPRAAQPTAKPASRGGKTLGRSANAAQVGGSNPARRKATERRGGAGTGAGEGQRASAERPASERGRAGRADGGRKAPPKTAKKALPELRRVPLDAPPPGTVFRDRDGAQLTFPDSNLKRVAAAILTEKRKAWRYRPFSFPLFTDRGNEQAFHFDFYIYDAEDSVIRLILVVAAESREVWDRVGRFKRQYPMYAYELWTPEKLARLSGPRAQLGF